MTTATDAMPDYDDLEETAEEQAFWASMGTTLSQHGRPAGAKCRARLTLRPFVSEPRPPLLQRQLTNASQPRQRPPNRETSPTSSAHGCGLPQVGA